MAKKKKKKSSVKGIAQKRPLIRLSQCMIVKNEEANIRQALSWGKGVVWEQIVVDTGSSDHTAELARGLGAKVFSYPWTGDFSAAKNFAIEQAKGNWIAFLDADEWFQPEEVKKILPLLESIHSHRQIDVLRMKITNLNNDGSVISIGCQDRIFRNYPGLRYHYPIHEELCRSDDDGTATIFDVQNDLMILHMGYAGEEKRKQKGERNACMLKVELEKTPYDGMKWVYLGDAYRSMGDAEKALNCYQRVLEEPKMEMTHEVAPLRAGLESMSLLVNRPAAEVREKYLRINQRMKELGNNEHPDVDYFLGCMHLKAGELKAAATKYESALKSLETYRGLELTRITPELELVNRVIATVALLEGNASKAVTYAVSALRINKYSTDGIGILLRAFRTEWKEGMSAEPYWHFLSTFYDTENLKELLLVYKLSGEAGFPALQEQVRNAAPAQVRELLEARS